MCTTHRTFLDLAQCVLRVCHVPHEPHVSELSDLRVAVGCYKVRCTVYVCGFGVFAFARYPLIGLIAVVDAFWFSVLLLVDYFALRPTAPQYSSRAPRSVSVWPCGRARCNIVVLELRAVSFRKAVRGEAPTQGAGTTTSSESGYCILYGLQVSACVLCRLTTIHYRVPACDRRNDRHDDCACSAASTSKKTRTTGCPRGSTSCEKTSMGGSGRRIGPG